MITTTCLTSAELCVSECESVIGGWGWTLVEEFWWQMADLGVLRVRMAQQNRTPALHQPINVLVKTDSGYVYRNWQQGHRKHVQNLELWTRFWALCDHDLLEVTLQKVQAHAKPEELAAGVVTWADYEGNLAADRIAGQIAH